LPKFHVDSIQQWPSFEYAGTRYDLGHLDCHEIIFKGRAGDFRFVVTYGLHCFTKNDTDHNIDVHYPDGRHARRVCLERYEASKGLRRLLEQLDQGTLIYQTEGERFFTFRATQDNTGAAWLYKVCLAIFREHRLLRIHVSSAYFVNASDATVALSTDRKGFTIFKIAIDTRKKPKGQCPKEVRNRHRV
jgi:hypothetical protein